MRMNYSNITNDKQKQIIEFSDWILNIGNNTMKWIKHDENEAATWIEILKKYIINFDSNPIETISNSIYSDFINNFDNIEYLKERAIVVPKNRTVDDINKYILSLVPNKQKTYYIYDTIIPSYENIDELNVLYPEEFLHTLNFNSVPPHELNLKVGIPIVLLRNLNQSIGLCNRTKLIIT